MQTLLFGVLALSGEPGKLPIYTALAWLRRVAGLALLAQLGSLGAGLAVMLPRRWSVNTSHSPRRRESRRSKALDSRLRGSDE